MARLPNKFSVVRALFARSGNKCAFPDCHHPLITDRNIFVAQICHIESAEQNGPRFNKDQNDEQRRSYENLILMCYRHHKETDDKDEYPTSILKEMKAKHEEKFLENIFTIKEEVLKGISLDFENFWSEVKYRNENFHRNIGMERDIDFDASFFEKMDDLKLVINSFKEILKNYHKEQVKILPTQWQRFFLHR